MASSDDPFDAQDEDIDDESDDGEEVEQDAISLLSSDHAEVKQMFEEYRQLVEGNGSDDRRGELARQICSALTVHAEIEEDIFYPAMRENIDDELLLDQAEVEHESAEELIEQIEDMDPGDALFDARVLVLGEYVEHHVQEEENEIFPQAETSGIDLDELGAALAERKRELMAALEED
jgi:hemerythrin-like domain-containing protein